MTATLVIGGTGVMGGRVVRRLLESTSTAITVLTRDPGSDRATQLRQRGEGRVRIVEGSLLDDPSHVREIMAGSEQVFCNTDFFARNTVVEEYRQGVAALDAAEAEGVDKFIWSSLDGAATLTCGAVPVPHYDAKAAVAARINMLRSEEMMQKTSDGWYRDHVSILTTSPYYENLQGMAAPEARDLPDGRTGLVFSLPLDTGRYPLVGLDDIAWFASFMFENWQSWGSSDLAVTGDSLAGEEIAATFERVTGTPSAYQPMPLDVLEASVPTLGHDYAAMFRFFQKYDVFERGRDIRFLRDLHPSLETFESWLRRTGWSGTATDVF